MARTVRVLYGYVKGEARRTIRVRRASFAFVITSLR